MDARHGFGVTRYVWPEPGTHAPVGKITLTQLYQPGGLNFGAGAYFDEIGAEFHDDLAVNLAKAGLVVLLVWLLLRSIIGGEPSLAVHLVDRMANGDLSAGAFRRVGPDQAARRAATP